MQSFEGIHERNQCFIDGGLFAMSVLYSLHAKGLATCPLNWSADEDQDMRLRSVIDIKPAENVIMMIAVGHYPPHLNVAKSTRKNVSEIFTVY